MKSFNRCKYFALFIVSPGDCLGRALHPLCVILCRPEGRSREIFRFFRREIFVQKEARTRSGSITPQTVCHPPLHGFTSWRMFAGHPSRPIHLSCIWRDYGELLIGWGLVVVVSGSAVCPPRHLRHRLVARVKLHYTTPCFVCSAARDSIPIHKCTDLIANCVHLCKARKK